MSTLLSLLIPVAQAATAFGPESKIPIAEAKTTAFSNIEDGILVIANAILGNLTLIAGILAVFFLVFAGIKYITAGGDANRTKEARAGVFSVIIGVIIITIAFFIVRLAVGTGNSIGDLDN